MGKIVTDKIQKGNSAVIYNNLKGGKAIVCKDDPERSIVVQSMA